MKTNRILTIVAATVLLMTSCSNDDERMLTIINEDGTCSREIFFHPYPQGVMAKADEPIEDHCLPSDISDFSKRARTSRSKFARFDIRESEVYWLAQVR